MVSSTSNKSLNFAAQLLDVSPAELKMSLTTRMMSAGGADMRSDQRQHQRILCCIIPMAFNFLTINQLKINKSNSIRQSFLMSWIIIVNNTNKISKGYLDE